MACAVPWLLTGASIMGSVWATHQEWYPWLQDIFNPDRRT